MPFAVKTTEQERGAQLFLDFNYCYRFEAGGTILPNRLAALSATGEVQAAAFNSTDVVGVYMGDASCADGDQISLGLMRQTVVADQAITYGQRLKSAPAGKVLPLVDSALAGGTIEDNVGLAFTNQPANDGVEVVSSDAGDTTQTVTIYYTRNGQGDTVFTETKTLNGTTQVVFTHTDIELVLAGEKSAATTGTITFREASGNLTIFTLAAATLSSGKIAVTAGQTRAYNVEPTAVAEGATTKQVGLIGTDENGATLYDSQALNGTTAVTFNDTFNTVTFLLVGDLESTRTVTVKVGVAEDERRCVGKALTTQASANGLLDAIIMVPGI